MYCITGSIHFQNTALQEINNGFVNLDSTTILKEGSAEFTAHEASKKHIFPACLLKDEHSPFILAGDIRIYNAEALLEKLGIKEIKSDHHLLLEAYKKWGARCLDCLNGDFSFIVWDTERQELFAARDHIGVIPFFYSFEENHFIFSTRFAGVDNNLQTKKTINDEWILYFLLDRQKDKIQTIYNEVNRLEPGHYLTIKTNKLNIQRYWSLETTPSLRNITQEEAIRELHTKLIQAVKSRTKGITSIGVELSGGLDSSSVAAIARKVVPDSAAVNAYTNVLPETDKSIYHNFYDEWEKAAKVTAFSGITCHIPIEAPVADACSLAEVLLRQHGMPSIYYFSVLQKGVYEQAVAHGNQLIFSGFGGDELVSENAVKRYYTTVWKKKGLPGLINTYRKQGSSLPKAVYKAVRFIEQVLLKKEEQYKEKLFQKRWKNVFITDKLIQQYNLKTTFRELFYYPTGQTLKERSLYHVSKAGLVERLETGYSITGDMGLIYSFPLFDRELMEFYYSLPDELKGNHTISRFLFREACKGVLPEELLQQAKPSNAYTVPFFKTQIIRETEQLIAYCRNIPPNSKVFHYIDRAKLEQLTPDPVAAEPKLFQILLNIIMVERFLQTDT